MKILPHGDKIILRMIPVAWTRIAAGKILTTLEKLEKIYENNNHRRSRIYRFAYSS
jgi:hypothetical protein